MPLPANASFFYSLSLTDSVVVRRGLDQVWVGRVVFRRVDQTYELDDAVVHAQATMHAPTIELQAGDQVDAGAAGTYRIALVFKQRFGSGGAQVLARYVLTEVV